MPSYYARVLLTIFLVSFSLSLSAHKQVVVVPLGEEKLSTIADDGVIDDSEASDNLSIDNGLLKALSGGNIVDVNGQVLERATYTVDGVDSVYTVSNERYVIESSPATVGTVQALDHEIVTRLCQDIDGCDIYVAMINWSAIGQPGNVASSQRRMFYSQVEDEGSYWWRIDTSGESEIDGAGTAATIVQLFDCLLVDAETSTNSLNGRSDLSVGLGLLNVVGGSYSDATVTCRVIIED